MIGAVNRLDEHCPVVWGEADSAARVEWPVVLHPHSGADGARGLAAQAGGAPVFYQDDCRAADGDTSDWNWPSKDCVSPVYLHKCNNVGVAMDP